MLRWRPVIVCAAVLAIFGALALVLHEIPNMGLGG